MENEENEENESQSWKIDLELLLLDDPKYPEIKKLCQNRPVPDYLRKDIWRVCLKPELHSNAMQDFDEVFDLINQSLVHSDCINACEELIQQLVLPQQKSPDSDNLIISDALNHIDIDADTTSKFSVPSSSRLSADFESVITHFSKTYGYEYFSDNGWLRILTRLYSTLRCDNRNQLYAYFISVHHRFIAAGFGRDNRACTVLRLLLQYHEPSLCSFLDCKKIGIQEFANEWLMSLFTSVLNEKTVLALWDVCFLISDPLFAILVTVVILINSKSIIMESECSNKEDLLNLIRSLPKPMEPEDVLSLRDITLIFADQTPKSFRINYLPLLFGNADPEPGQCLLSDSMCITINSEEVLQYSLSGDLHSFPRKSLDHNEDVISQNSENSDKSNNDSSIRFFIVDSRPPKQYNAGHLPIAFFLDAKQIMDDPGTFRISVESLLHSQKRAIENNSSMGGEHIVFLSSGNEEDDSVLNMVIAYFLRENIQYISILDGGYHSLHEALGPLGCNRILKNHSPQNCLVCCSAASQDSTTKPLLASTIVNNNNSYVNTTTGKLAQSANQVAKIAVQTFKNNTALTDRFFRRFSSLVKTQNSQTQHEDLCETVKPKIIPKQYTTPSLGYRNTSAIFTLDDDEEDDDEGFESQFNLEKPLELSPRKSLPEKSFILSPSKSLMDEPYRPGGLDTCEVGDLIEPTNWFKRPEVKGVFTCRFLNTKTSQFDSSGVIVLAQRAMLVLQQERDVESTVAKLGGTAKAVGRALTGVLFLQNKTNKMISDQESTVGQNSIVKRNKVILVIPIVHLLRITSNKKIPELITFHYGSPDLIQLGQEVANRYKIYIPEAGEAVKMIKTAIFQANDLEIN